MDPVSFSILISLNVHSIMKLKPIIIHTLKADPEPAYALASHDLVNLPEFLNHVFVVFVPFPFIFSLLKTCI